MRNPWTAQQHMQMHWRPDAITRTGVIQPMWVRQVSPVDMARHTVDPFLASVRGPGPAVSPYPAPEDIAYAAGKLAKQFSNGQSAVIGVGTDKVTVDANTRCGGIVGVLTEAARQLMAGKSVGITVGGRKLVITPNGTDMPNVTASAPYPAGNQQVVVGPTAGGQDSSQANQQVVGPTAGNQGLGRTHARRRRQLGDGMTEMLPNVPVPQNIPAADVDYGAYYRRLAYDDNNWSQRDFRAQLAQRFAPNAMKRMDAMTYNPIQYAQQQIAVPLQSRGPLATQARPIPNQVPRQVNVRAMPDANSVQGLGAVQINRQYLVGKGLGEVQINKQYLVGKRR